MDGLQEIERRNIIISGQKEAVVIKCDHAVVAETLWEKARRKAIYNNNFRRFG